MGEYDYSHEIAAREAAEARIEQLEAALRELVEAWGSGPGISEAMTAALDKARSILPPEGESK